MHLVEQYITGVLYGERPWKRGTGDMHNSIELDVHGEVMPNG